MRKIVVLYDFIKLNTAIKIIFYRSIIDSFTNSTVYTIPDVPLADSIAAVDALEAAYLGSRNGDRVATSTIHECEHVADDIFRLHAAYVDRIANGNETLILSSGFNKTNVPLAHQKSDFEVKDDPHSGDVILVKKAVDRAKSYFWKFSKGPLPVNAADWKELGHSTRSTFPVSGLEIGVNYNFIGAGVTPEGLTDFSAPVSRLSLKTFNVTF